MTDIDDVTSLSLRPLYTATPLSRRERVVRALHLGAYRSGLSAFTARRSGSSATVLMYHSVPEPAEEPWLDPRSCHRPELFDRQMSFLARHRNVVSIDRLVEMLEAAEPFPPGTVAITFDDGYRNNLRVAAPILADHGLPATVYLATDLVDRGRNQWIDVVYSAFRARTTDELDLTDQHPDLRHWSLAGQRHEGDEAAAAYGTICDVLIEVEPDHREAILDAIVEQLAPSAQPPRMTLDWDEVRTMADEHPHMTIGVHTANHVDLRLHADLAEREAKSCIAHVEAETGRRPEHFAFPYNRHDEATEAEIARHFRSSVGEDPTDPVVRPGHGVHGIRRVAAPWSMTMLRSFTDGGYPDATKRLFGTVWAKPF